MDELGGAGLDLQDETKSEPDPAVRERGQERDHDCPKSIS